MLGLLWYAVSTVACGVLLVARFGTTFTLAEYVAITLPVGAVVPAWIVYLVACLTSALGPHTLIGSSAIIGYALYENWSRVLVNGPKVLKSVLSNSTERMDTMIATGIILVSSIFMIPLYSSRMIPEQDGKIWSGGSCWADLPIHMTIVESFLSGRNQDVSWGGLHSPVFAGEKLAYPFMPDFHAAVMVRMGSSVRTAFLVPGLAMCFSLFAMMYLLTLRITRSRLGGLLSIILLVGAGGMGGWNLWARDGFWNAVTKDTAQNDAVGADGRIVWFAFLPHVFLPQRGASFAYPLCLAVLLMVWRATDAGDKQLKIEGRKWLLVTAGALSGLLPLVQAHAFVAMGCIIGTIALFDFHKWLADPRLVVAWAQAGIIALIEAYPQIRLFRHQVESGAAGHFIKYGFWFKNHDVGQPGGLRGFFNFWWMNTGPALSLFLLVCIVYGLEVVSALIYAEQIRHHAGGAPALGHSASAGSLTAAATSTSGDVLDRLYETEQPVPVWQSVTNKSAAKAARASTAGDVPSTGRSSGVGGPGAKKDDDAEGEWSLEQHDSGYDDNSEGEEGEDAAEGAERAVKRPTTPQLLAMAANASGLGRSGGSASLELRIAHLEMEYTLPGVATSAGSDPSKGPPRFKLELPHSPANTAQHHTTLMISHVGGGTPDMGLHQLVANNSTPATSAGAAAHPKPSPAQEAGAAPPRGARVAKAYVDLRDSKKAPHFAAHVWAHVKQQLANMLGVHVDDLFDAGRYSMPAVDRTLWSANRLSLSGRSWDTLKLAMGAGLVFLLGNYVNFQPWDRDNCKLFYFWVMLNAILAGSLLAAPVEFFLGFGPGAGRMPGLLPIAGLAGYGRALYLSQGTTALPTALFPPAHRLGAAALVSSDAAASAIEKKSEDRDGGRATSKSGKGGSGTSLSPLVLGASAPQQLTAARVLSGLILLLAPWLIAKATLTGFMMVYREYGLYHVLLDEDQRATGAWIKEHVAPKAVMVYKDIHITPSSCLAGRPALISYTGWMWSHGYNYGDRDRDRNYILDNAMKDSDNNAYNAMRRWGVRYVVGENMQRHQRAPGNEDSDMFLDGQLKKVFSQGRFDILEVLGYGFPPN